MHYFCAAAGNVKSVENSAEFYRRRTIKIRQSYGRISWCEKVSGFCLEVPGGLSNPLQISPFSGTKNGVHFIDIANCDIKSSVL